MDSEDTKSPFSGLSDRIRSGKSASAIEFENRTPELYVKRGEDGSLGRGIVGKILMAYRNSIAASTFRVMIDGIEVGQLDQVEQLKIQVEPGLRKIKICAALATSNEISHEFGFGDRLVLNCRTKLFGIALFR